MLLGCGTNLFGQPATHPASTSNCCTFSLSVCGPGLPDRYPNASKKDQNGIQRLTKMVCKKRFEKDIRKKRKMVTRTYKQTILWSLENITRTVHWQPNGSKGIPLVPEGTGANIAFPGIRKHFLVSQNTQRFLNPRQRFYSQNGVE